MYMAVIRVEKDKNFTCMSNYHLKDKRLSLKAKGLMSQMLSLPDDWDYSVAGLVAINKEEQGAVNSALKELKDAGYLEVVKNMPSKDNGGRIDYEYVLHEKSVTINKKQEGSFQGVEIQGIEIQGVENRDQLNTNIINTKEQNTKELSVKKESKKESKKEATFDAIMDSVSVIANNPSLRDTIVEFIKMRKRIKAPLTDRALMLNINEAYKLSKGDAKQMQAIFEQSIRNSYRGVFPLKEEGGYQKQNSNTENPFTAIKKKEGRI